MSDSRRGLSLLLYRGHVRGRKAVLRLDRRALIYFAAMVLLIGLAGWLYLHQTSTVAGYAHDIRTLEESKEVLHRELVSLRGNVAMLGSLERIRAVGREMGYSLPPVTEADRFMYIDIELSTADADTPSRSGVEPRTQQAKSLLDALVDGFIQWLEREPLSPAIGNDTP